jgi:hypothetical protein
MTEEGAHEKTLQECRYREEPGKIEKKKGGVWVVRADEQRACRHL